MASREFIAYFQPLVHDLIDLGEKDLSPKSIPEDTDDVAVLLNMFFQIQLKDALLENLDGQNIHSLTKTALSWVNSLPVNETDYGACYQSEPRFYRSLKNSLDPHKKSPLILLQDGSPAGIAKPYGESTVYSFVDIPEKGLFQDTLCSNIDLGVSTLHDDGEVTFDSWPRKLAKIAGVYTLDLAECEQPFTPLRPSILQIPNAIRSELLDTADGPGLGFWASYGLPLDSDRQLFLNCAMNLLQQTDVVPVEIPTNF